MADKTAIEWTDATWNPIRALITAADGTQRTGWHCEHASEGCRFCYAEGFNLRLGTQRPFKPSEIDTGAVHLFLDKKILLQPLYWKRPRKIFLGSMTDIFARFVPDAWIDRIFAIMALTPHHTYQVLTKRADRMLNGFALRRKYSALSECIAELYVTQPEIAARWPFDKARAIAVAERGWLLPNVWLGVSVENQAAADERIPLLLQTPAAKRFISAEPLLGPLSLRCIPWTSDRGFVDATTGETQHKETRARDPDRYPDTNALDWVIAGGESGPNARPMHPHWARALRDQCARAGVPFFFKQWGEWSSVVDREKDDPDWQIQYSNPALQFGNGQYQFHNVAGGRGFHGDQLHLMKRVGKKAAGALLDGIAHQAFPA
jgi:protein gp37